ncbi:MAG: bifunctional glutamate N-acetyltransferase/amino-acid acetyltransferase ArgJ [Chromatiales bacterium]|jgi:glutamate N-acetyltransferase/amino-acid N-acetyltransferase
MNPQSEALSISGIRLAAAAAGIKYRNRDREDVVLLECAEGSVAAAVFTSNAFCAAPVTLARQHLREADVRYLIINSGNANAGTGAAGLQAAQQTCLSVAASAGCEASQVMPFSTGVIGQLLPQDKIAAVVPELVENLDEAGWPRAAKAIMTTDTVPKLVSRQTEINGHMVTVTGMAKGSGMIRPDMATMLAFLATDIKISQPLLQQCLQQAVNPSFNSITVDGDTSTNDACVLLSSCRNELSLADENDAAFGVFCELVTEVCMELARAIVLDGEGATKLIEIVVEQATSEAEARDVAYTIAHSPLVKTAMFASDPNWGRILAAVGRAGVASLDIDQVQIWLGDVCIVEQGGVAASYTEVAGQAVMNQPEIMVRVSLGRGQAQARVLTCDLSYDYVKINAEYRT